MGEPSLRELRERFGAGRFLAMPVAGMTAWTTAGLLGTILPEKTAAYGLFVSTGMTFPLALLLSRWTKEDLLGSTQRNDLDGLFGLIVFMCNLGWAIGVPFWMVYPSSLPLSAGVLGGLIWLPFSWLILHWVGYAHAIARTLLIVAFWFAMPNHRFRAIPFLVAILYLLTIIVLLRRTPARTRF